MSGKRIFTVTEIYCDCDVDSGIVVILNVKYVPY